VIEKTVTICHKQGLHVRPCGIFVKASSRFQSDVTLEKDGVPANGKSILGLMMLAAEAGAVVKLICDGPDEQDAAETLEKILSSDFNLEEAS